MTTPPPAAAVLPAGTAAVHDPGDFAKELASQQASSDRRLRFLFGAGASLAGGYPTLATLGTAVHARLMGAHGKVVDDLFSGRNLEEVLTRVRRIGGVLDAGETLGGLDPSSAQELEEAITAAIVLELSAVVPAANPYLDVVKWALQSERRTPIELFTLNYDVSLELALDGAGAAYFDGFAGTLQAQFRADLVDGASTRNLPPFVIRLWKLHGSMNWAVEGTPDRRVVLRGPTPAAGAPAAIYPSEEKYQASRRAPFVVLHDRFRKALDEPESLLIIAGYSFGDQHLNEIIYDAALRNPRNAIVAFCHSSIPDELADRADRAKNIAVAGPKDAIWGGKRGSWATDDVPGVSSAGRLELVDFSALAAHLASAASPTL